MLLLLPGDYLLGMAVWLVIMAATLLVLLKLRRTSKGKKLRMGCVNAGLSLWMVLTLITGTELYFALFVDRSDSFNRTNISKRWIERYIDAQKNQAGYRDSQELLRRVPQGVQRIIFVGDSFTAGQGIPRREDRFTDILRAELEQARPGKVQVANMGELGLEVAQITARVEGLLQQDYDISMIVYVYMLNDIEGYDPATIHVMQNLGRFDPQTFILRYTYFLNWAYFQSMRVWNAELREYFSKVDEAYQGEPWKGVERKLIELETACRKRNVEFRMVIFPFVHNLGEKYPYREIHQQLVEHCRKRGIKALDLEPVLSPHVSEGLAVNRFDAHPNERANRLAADAMKSQLLEDFFASPNDSE